MLLACGVGVALAVLAWWPSPGVNKRNFDRIEIGMTRAEVEAIFGDHPQYPAIIYPAIIDFDDGDCVAAKEWRELPDERTVWERLLDRLPWRERRAVSFYTKHAPEYFPPSPSYPLAADLPSIEEAQRKLDEGARRCP